jgi:nucleoside-diphosphate-sugar epimerase
MRFGIAVACISLSLLPLGPTRHGFVKIHQILIGKRGPIKVFNQVKHRSGYTYIDDIVEGLMREHFKHAAANPAWQ